MPPPYCGKTRELTLVATGTRSIPRMPSGIKSCGKAENTPKFLLATLESPQSGFPKALLTLKTVSLHQIENSNPRWRPCGGIALTQGQGPRGASRYPLGRLRYPSAERSGRSPQIARMQIFAYSLEKFNAIVKITPKI